MTTALPDFTRAHVLIVGDTMLDRYWKGDTQRISPEAPVPVVQIKQVEECPGGAGNVALNIAALGAEVTIQGLLGEDAAGQRLQALLQQARVSTHLQTLANKPTITKSRVIGLNQQLLRLDIEESFTQAQASGLMKDFPRLLTQAHVLLLSDYAKGTLAHVQDMIVQANQAGMIVLVDPKGADFEKYRGAFLLTPNQKEFESIVGPCHSEEDFIMRGTALLQGYDLQALLITRGSAGMILLQRDREPYLLKAQAHEVFDVTGAGDTVIGVLAASLAAGTDLEQAVMLANTAAGIAVTKLGAATVSSAEMQLQLQRQHSPLQEHGIIEETTLLGAVHDAKLKGERVVMTNGCFDILHAGHVQYLSQAKRLGDRLIVAVNTDASVAQLKGPERPVNKLIDRMQVLAALSAVDWVIAFSEATPARLIEAVKPDVLVKGGDYQAIDQIAGSASVIANGGDVKILSLREGVSTTRLIDKIQAQVTV